MVGAGLGLVELVEELRGYTKAGADVLQEELVTRALHFMHGCRPSTIAMYQSRETTPR